jgi:hypothetical protein
MLNLRRFMLASILLAGLVASEPDRHGSGIATILAVPRGPGGQVAVVRRGY